MIENATFSACRTCPQQVECDGIAKKLRFMRHAATSPAQETSGGHRRAATTLRFMRHAATAPAQIASDFSRRGKVVIDAPLQFQASCWNLPQKLSFGRVERIGRDGYPPKKSSRGKRPGVPAARAETRQGSLPAWLVIGTPLGAAR